MSSNTIPIPEEDVRKVVSEVMHPVINCTLVELGIVKDITVTDNNKALITMAFPFPNIPIKDLLVNSVSEPLKKLGIEVEVKITLMSEKEVQAFLAMEAANWKI